jgi:hypothetical protein
MQPRSLSKDCILNKSDKQNSLIRRSQLKTIYSFGATPVNMKNLKLSNKVKKLKNIDFFSFQNSELKA